MNKQQTNKYTDHVSSKGKQKMTKLKVKNAKTNQNKHTNKQNIYINIKVDIAEKNSYSNSSARLFPRRFDTLDGE